MLSAGMKFASNCQAVLRMLKVLKNLLIKSRVSGKISFENKSSSQIDLLIKNASLLLWLTLFPIIFTCFFQTKNCEESTLKYMIFNNMQNLTNKLSGVTCNLMELFVLIHLEFITGTNFFPIGVCYHNDKFIALLQ